MRRWLLGLIFFSVFPSIVSAEVTIIYRKADRLYVGKVVPPQPVSVELLNLTRSSLGGVVEDYATVTVPTIPKGTYPVIAEDGTVTFKEYEKVAKRKLLRASIRAKLLAGQPLTPQEADYLLP